MHKFSVGDRVAVYGHASLELGKVYRGTVAEVQGDALLVAPGYLLCHPKQCRRLKPKRERREIWIRCAGMGMSTLSCRLQNDAVILNLGSSGPAGYVLFREVCPKRGVK
jgi:hypothetical protein